MLSEMTGSRWLTEIKEKCLILESVYHLIAHGKQKMHVHQKQIFLGDINRYNNYLHKVLCHVPSSRVYEE